MTGRTVVPGPVDNDANCHALAELRAGAAQGVEEALVVTLGTGIGAGGVTGGQVLHGMNGFAGATGHMIVNTNGPPRPPRQRRPRAPLPPGPGPPPRTPRAHRRATSRARGSKPEQPP